MDTRPRSGPPPRYGWIRLRSRPGPNKQMRPIVQRFRWRHIFRLKWPPTFWADWYPAENAVRSLEHEVIECLERVAWIIEHEHPNAEAWVQQCFEKLAVSGNDDGITPYWYEEILDRETEMPNAREKFDRMVKLFPKGRIDATRPQGGARTLYTLTDVGRLADHKHLFNREELGAMFDDIINFKVPSVFHKKPQNQNQGGKGNQQKKPPEFSWED